MPFFLVVAVCINEKNSLPLLAQFLFFPGQVLKVAKIIFVGLILKFSQYLLAGKQVKPARF